MAQLSPVGILQAGSSLAETLVQNLNIQGLLGSVAGAFFAPLLGILLFIAFLIIAAQMVVALVEGFIVMSGGVLLLGFLGSPWTARFGLSYFATLAGSGIKLFMIYIIVAIGGGLIAGPLRRVHLPPHHGAGVAPRLLLWAALAAAGRLVTPKGLVYLELPEPLAPEAATAAGYELVRAATAGRVAFHLPRRTGA